ncbi:hypothetical protein [Zongyangia hominis]|uniref:Uncharacterized protein n=1 Tax=Zongyangia hominis TaxID=2763677 RepID=A0A926EFP9_9FIRM|nr:hypothetical protein [Zongyangia hominis]MBC8571329.1 hypothetical protein [Zongyangia hominis]
MHKSKVYQFSLLVVSQFKYEGEIGSLLKKQFKNSKNLGKSRDIFGYNREILWKKFLFCDIVKIIATDILRQREQSMETGNQRIMFDHAAIKAAFGRQKKEDYDEKEEMVGRCELVLHLSRTAFQFRFRGIPRVAPVRHPGWQQLFQQCHGAIGRLLRCPGGQQTGHLFP